MRYLQSSNIQCRHLIGPHEGELITKGTFEPIFEVPAFINAKKLNTVIWSIATGIVLYGLIRLIFRKRIGCSIKTLCEKY